MSTASLIRNGGALPSLFDDFFRPWNGWLDTNWPVANTMNVPAVNIQEGKEDFTLSLAVPGMKKDDFKVDVQGNMLTISCSREEEKEKKDTRFTRKEYNFSSFSRSFTLPEEVSSDKIEAAYEEGVLKLRLPKKEEAKKLTAGRHIDVK